MAPAISEDEAESDGPDAIPAKGKIPIRGKADEPEEDEDEESDDEDPDEFRVEKILTHDFAEDGTTIYQIKWLGYEKKSDLTWEPVENLENAQDILDAYHHKIGGPPEPPEIEPASPKKKGGRKRSGGAKRKADSPAVEASTRKRGRKSGGDANGSINPSQHQLPEGSWEDYVLRVSSIVEDTDLGPKKAKGKQTKALNGLLEWTNGNKTQHPMVVLRRKCPQKLLDYYEQHIVFKHGDTG